MNPMDIPCLAGCCKFILVQTRDLANTDPEQEYESGIDVRGFAYV